MIVVHSLEKKWNYEKHTSKSVFKRLIFVINVEYMHETDIYRSIK